MRIIKLNLIKSLQLIIIVALLTSAKFANAQDLIKDTRNDKTTTITEQDDSESIIYTTYHSIIKNENLKQVNLFELTKDTPELYAKQSDYVNDAVLLKKNYTKINSLIKERPNHFQFEIPVTSGKSITLELTQVDFLGKDFKVKTGDNQIVKIENKALFYHGYVKGNPNSLAAISVFENEVKGVVSDSGGDYVLASLNKEDDISIFYNDRDLKNRVSSACAMEDTEKYLNTEIDNNVKNYQKSNSLGCVDVRIECDYSFYQAHNSKLTNVYEYVLALFNEGVIIYANENIDLKLEEIIVWRTPSPYPLLAGNIDDPGDDILDDYTQYRQNMDDGPINNLLYSKPNWSGGWAWVDFLCKPYNPTSKKGPFCVTNSYSTTLTPFPDYSQDLENFVHEIGHVLGSRHTHDCVWGPNSNATLDNCGLPYLPGVPQPSCAHGPAPTNGGTIMSYCASGYAPPGETVQVATLYGINLINGLGDFPGTVNNPRALITNRVSNASCCSGTDLCNESVFTQYSWLNPLVNKDNCTDETIDVYKVNSAVSFINVYKNGQDKLYYNGTLWCSGSHCVNSYGLTNLVDHWSCDCGAEPECDNDPVLSQYPVASTHVNENTCTSEKITVYNKWSIDWLFIETPNWSRLYRGDTGQLWCTSSANYDCVAMYGLTNPIANWECCNSGLKEDETATQEDFLIFPNPNNGVFNLMIPGSLQEDFRAEVYSIDGKRLKQIELDSNLQQRIDLAELSSGLYLIRVVSGSYNATQKFTIR